MSWVWFVVSMRWEIWRQTNVFLLAVWICQKIQTTKNLLSFSISSNSCLWSSALLFWPLILLVFTEISQETAVNPVDIVSTLQSLQMLKYWKGKHLILKRQVGSYAIRFIKSKYKHNITQNILISTKTTEEAKMSELNYQAQCRDKCYIQGLENSGIPSSSFVEG